MTLPFDKLPEGKKLYFISDFHLGVPDYASSLEREKKIVQWLSFVEKDAAAIFLMGDIFDFWFEFKHVIPKGFVRLQGKLASITDSGIPVYWFTGNHDMWIFDYFTKELNVQIFRQPEVLVVNNKKMYIGHGDGLGPGDRFYKSIKKIFANSSDKMILGELRSFVTSKVGRGLPRTKTDNGSTNKNKTGADQWVPGQERAGQSNQSQLKP